MATGDSNDLISRIRRWLPSGWFPSLAASSTCRVYRYFAQAAGNAAVFAQTYAQITYAGLQIRLATISDGFVDLAAYDFFGNALRRRTNETDAALSLRIRKEVVRERNTRPAVVQALQDIGCTEFTIFEPANPADAGGWDCPNIGWDVAGGWGDTDLPNQAFICVALPAGGTSGIPNVGGWDTQPLAWDTTGQWTDASEETVSIGDSDIYAALNAVRPIGTILWTQIGSGQLNAPAGSPGYTASTL